MEAEKGNIKLVHASCGLDRKNEWQAANPNTVIKVGEYCKLGIPDGEKVEHMWILVTHVIVGRRKFDSGTDSRKFKGILHNTPVVITNCEWGDIIDFDYEDISDVIKK